MSLCGLCLATSAWADGPWTMSTGMDMSQGLYGGSSQTEMRIRFVALRYAQGDFSHKLTLPWLELTGPGAVASSGDGMIVVPGGNSATRSRVSGWGDTLWSSTWSAYTHGPHSLDVGVRLKWATCSVSQGLSTGKNDVAGQVSYYYGSGAMSAMISGGYKWMGRVDGQDYRDVAFAALGLTRRVGAGTSIGVVLDWRQSVVSGVAEQWELSAYAAHELDHHWGVQGWLYSGFSHASPDVGAGMAVSYRF